MIRSSQFTVRSSQFVVRGLKFKVRSLRFKVRSLKFKVRGSGVLAGVVCCALFFAACSKPEKEQKLPILGEREVVGDDTLFHTIDSFQFVDQDSNVVTNKTVDGKIYVADFFFTSCRTICPVMKTQMLRVYDSIQDDPDVLLLSHTIDPEYDTVALLHDFADRLGVKSDKWHFVTGLQDDIFKIAQTSYFATAMADEEEPDGYIHSGAFLLIDKKGRIRGKYDGTVEADVSELIRDIAILQKEDDAKK